MAHMQILTLRSRVLAALLIGCAFGIVTWHELSNANHAIQGSDFTYPWLAAQALIHGQNPYTYVAHSVTPVEPVFLYPLSAAVLATPFAWFSAKVAAVLFVVVGFAALAFVLSRDGWWRLVIFVSAPAYAVAYSAQWSPLLMACALTIPAVGLLMCKPTIGIPLLAFQSSERAIAAGGVGVLVLLAISYALVPTWPLDWIHAMRGAIGQYQPPILTPFGAVLVLAVLRWRQPEARLLLFMACMPQNALFYDQFPLLLIPKTRREALIAACCSFAAYLYGNLFVQILPGMDRAGRTAQLLPYVIAGLYLPALVMVLRRPNEGLNDATFSALLGRVRLRGGLSRVVDLRARNAR